MTDSVGIIGSGVIHAWPGDLSLEIAQSQDFGTKESIHSVSKSTAQLRAMEPVERAKFIASELYSDPDYRPDFRAPAFYLANSDANAISEVLQGKTQNEESGQPKARPFIEYRGDTEFITKQLKQIAFLQYALNGGSTPSQLVAWGVDPFIVTQLMWLSTGGDRTRLSRHICAIRNGWGLPILEQTWRTRYRQLLEQADERHRAGLPVIGRHAVVESKLVLDFFSPGAKALNSVSQSAWAEAFLKNDLAKIAPDAVGKHAHYCYEHLQSGTLPQSLEYIARYLESIDVMASDWASFDEKWFGRA